MHPVLAGIAEDTVAKICIQTNVKLCTWMMAGYKATTSSLSGPTWTSLCGLPSKGRAVPGTVVRAVVRVLCQALELTAFLVHPVLAAIAEDAVAAHSSVTDGAWKLT